MSTPVATGKMAQQEGIQPAVLYKLVTFAILMAVIPIGTYFGTLKSFWPGNTTYSAIAAVITANIVLVGYVVVAFQEEAADAKAAKANTYTALSEKRKDR